MKKSDMVRKIAHAVIEVPAPALVPVPVPVPWLPELAQLTRIVSRRGKSATIERAGNLPIYSLNLQAEASYSEAIRPTRWR